MASDAYCAKRVGTPSIVFNFSWTLVGRLIYSASQWAMLIMIARDLGIAAVGQWGIAVAIANPVFAFLDFKLRWVLSTSGRDQYSTGDFLAFRLFTMLCGIATVAAAPVVMGAEAGIVTVVALIALCKGVEHLSEVLFGVLQREERMDLVGRSLVIRGCLTLAAVYGAIIASGTLPIAIGAIFVAWLAVLILHDQVAARSVLVHNALRISINRHVLEKLLLTVLPLGAVALVVALGRSIPRYFLMQYYGETAVGLFTIIAYFHLLGDVVVTSLAHASIARLARRLRVSIGHFRRMLLQLAAFGGAVGFVCVGLSYFFSEQILTHVYGPDFACGSGPLTCLMLGSTAAYINAFLGAGLVTLSRPVLWSISSAAGAIACFCCSLGFVPGHGVLGASWAFAAGCWVSCLLAILFILRHCDVHGRELELPTT